MKLWLKKYIYFQRTNHDRTLTRDDPQPSLDIYISLAMSMVDEQQLAMYKGYHFEEFLEAFLEDCVGSFQDPMSDEYCCFG